MADMQDLRPLALVAPVTGLAMITIRADLARGESVVIQLVSTSEAMLNRALAALTVEERANLDIELSPREFVMSYLTAAFPVRQMKTYVDDTGKTRSEPMSDEDGRPAFSQEALEMRDNLLEQLCALPIVGSALVSALANGGVAEVARTAAALAAGTRLN